MPKIPMLSGPQVQESGYANQRVATEASAEAFNAGASTQALNKATLGFAEVMQEEKYKADKLATLDAINQLRRAKTSLIYDPKDGALNVKGKDSLKLPDQVGKAFDANADQIEQGLANETQKSLFRRARQEQGADLNQNISTHVFNQMNEYKGEVFKSSLAIEQDEAALNYKDPAKIKQHLLNAEALINDRANEDGWDEATKQNTLNTLKTKMHAGIIERALNNDEDQYAETYFNEFKSELKDADQLQTLEKAIAEGTTKGKAMRGADEILGKAKSETEARKLAKEMFSDNPDVRDLVVRRVSDEFNFRQQELQQFRQENYLNSTNLLDTAKKQGLIGQKALDTIPPDKWRQLSLSERKALEDFASGKGTETNVTTYYDLKTKASIPGQRDEFLKLDLLKHANELSPSDMKEMIDLQASLRKGDKDAEKALDGFRTDMQIIDDTLTEAGFSNDDKEEKAKARRRAEELTQIFLQNNGRKPNNKEMQEISDQIAKKHVTDKGWIWDTTKSEFEMEPEERLNEIPAQERAEIESFLKANRKAVNQQNILRMYDIRKAPKRG